MVFVLVTSSSEIHAAARRTRKGPWCMLRVPGPVVTPPRSPPPATTSLVRSLGLTDIASGPAWQERSPALTARAARRGGNLARNTLRNVALLRTMPPRWQPRWNLDEGRVARRVVDPSIGRSGQRVGKHRHGPVHLWSRLLSFESGAVLVDPGRDARARRLSSLEEQ